MSGGRAPKWVPSATRTPRPEYDSVLARHDSVLTELVAGSALLVVTAGYSDWPEPEEPCRSPETVADPNPGGYRLA